MLDILLSLDRGSDIIIRLEIDEAFQSVALGKACYGANSVLMDALDKIACHAGVEDAVDLVGHKVNVAPRIGRCCKTWMAGTSPAMTRLGQRRNKTTKRNQGAKQ